MLSRVFILLSLAVVSVMAQTKGTGNLFDFVPELGACGFVNNSQQLVASVSRVVFENFKGATANPNDNPICKHKLLVKSGKKNVTAAIVDYYVNNKTSVDVGLSPVGFNQLSKPGQGIVQNVTWSII
ncbi:hypothetical protein D9619_002153 [Psilocybe cf. subviscida]|uniref:Barwin domain-containing protein n=1 Tax=Psilocybe cf. subviscida TaxID=2480587 RepID=A0A8H5BDA0_9AGAR|nr:hypothetical protein D9619_002153 [Psilocybe cf. subviscida]